MPHSSHSLPLFQKTLAAPVTICGIGVHGGQPATLVVSPADPHHGIVFQRTDLPGSKAIRAHWSQVSDTSLCTILGDRAGACVSTVEHILAACSALGLDNLHIALDGPEVPILDGSAQGFVKAFDKAGYVSQAARRRYIRVLKPVVTEQNDSYGLLKPAMQQSFDVTIDFAHQAIGRQNLPFHLSPAFFRRHIASARTFGFMKDVERLRAAHLAQGSGFDNTLVFGDDCVLNEEGQRYRDECVRHKALDAVGDLSLAGAPILGLYESYKGGHGVNFAMVRALFADKEAWEWTTLSELSEAEKSDARGFSDPKQVMAFSPELS
jgi:UDP-3-O-[3-hydroxymyristoyl] N-acetylglucosamine deacetylase